MSEGTFGLKRAAGRGQTLMAIGTVAVTGQATVTLNVLNIQAAIASIISASNVYEFCKLTSLSAPSLLINVTTSATVSTTARTCHYTIFGNSE